jgi:hypothetical protein
MPAKQRIGLDLLCWSSGGAATKSASQLGDSERGPLAVQHRVAVRADGPKVLNRIDLIVTAQIREFPQVVDIDEFVTDGAIGAGKVEAADNAVMPPIRKARVASAGVALVPVDHHSLGGSFSVCLRTWELLRKPRGLAAHRLEMRLPEFLDGQHSGVLPELNSGCLEPIPRHLRNLTLELFDGESVVHEKQVVPPDLGVVSVSMRAVPVPVLIDP